MSDHSIVGAWRVKSPDAPYPYHMFMFHSDGTMQQSNPPHSNQQISDTSGMGLWKATSEHGVIAKFEEYRLDFETGETTRGTVDFDLKVEGDKLSGSCAFNIYDLEDKHLKGPLSSPVEGTRVTLS